MSAKDALTPLGVGDPDVAIERGLLLDAALETMRRLDDVPVSAVTDIGLAPPDAGFLVGSPMRRRLYSSGEFRPRIGLVVWPRNRIIEWAAKDAGLEQRERRTDAARSSA